MPDQPTPGDDRFWCPVCREHVRPGYESAHSSQPSPEELADWLEYQRQHAAREQADESGT